MNVEYTGRQTTISAKLKLQTEAGLARIAKVVDRSATAHVILTEDKYRKIAEVTVKCRHGELVATCEDTDMEAALHDALQKVEHQAIKNKDRFETITRHGKAEAIEAV
ncbi:MAG TPA: ribosome-associated translation inhibitor RaiA [Acidobacteriaceae bacterium]|nr:ribosome-associated translation inhibitor RaiA [Acidobacteriaceae bacterium]